VPPFRLEARLYRPSEVAKLLGLPLPSIYVWIRAKEIRTTRIGGRYFVSPSELSRLLEGNK
jgi:excisionase family DNA binding protein